MVDPIARASADASRDGALADLELNLLLEAIFGASGHDFREFAHATLRRRVLDRMRAEGVATISGLQERVLHDAEARERFVFAMSGVRHPLFADPDFFKLLRERVVPLLRTYSFPRIWVPNCARAEDAYALAVVLHEEGLLDRTVIYATDRSSLAMDEARGGRFEIASAEDLKEAHRATGATQALSAVCALKERSVRFDDTLKASIIFAEHSVVSDASLNEFHAIVARGVLSQFKMSLQLRVHDLFLNSLMRLGFLCLGPNETLRATPNEHVFRAVAGDGPIYRRMR